MKRTISPVYIVIASALYFLIASILLEQIPRIDNKPHTNFFRTSTLDKFKNTTAIYAPLNFEENHSAVISNP
jgi:hypothetical protein